ncbi:MAG: VOC family protein [bacterium]
MTNFHHVGITCQNAQKSKEFYLKHFGFQLEKEVTAPAELIKNVFAINSPAKITYLISENMLIELFEFPEDKRPAVMGSISHFALIVPDRVALFEMIKADGHETIKQAKPNGGFVLFVKDPDGVLIELK